MWEFRVPILGMSYFVKSMITSKERILFSSIVGEEVPFNETLMKFVRFAKEAVKMPFEFTKRKKRRKKNAMWGKTEKAMAASHINFFYPCQKVLYKQLVLNRDRFRWGSRGSGPMAHFFFLLYIYIYIYIIFCSRTSPWKS